MVLRLRRAQLLHNDCAVCSPCTGGAVLVKSSRVCCGDDGGISWVVGAGVGWDACGRHEAVGRLMCLVTPA